MKLKLVLRFYSLLIISGIFLFHVTVDIIYYSSQTCYADCLRLWEKPYTHLDSDLILYIREQFIDPPPDVIQEPLQKEDYEEPLWMTHGGWQPLMLTIKWVFEPVKEGLFFEIGAGVGDIMSLTSWLESREGWKGFLVEPNPISYARIRRRRNSTSANVCASMKQSQYQTELWIPPNSDGFEEPYKSISMMGSRLPVFIDAEDELLGTRVAIQCLTIRTLLAVAAPFFQGESRLLHLVVIDTNGGETDILEDLIGYDIMTLVIKVVDPHQRKIADTIAKDLRLQPLTSSDHITNYAVYISVDIGLSILYARR